MLSWRTKEVKCQCLKCIGRMSFSNRPTSYTTNLVVATSASCLARVCIDLRFARLSERDEVLDARIKKYPVRGLSKAARLSTQRWRNSLVDLVDKRAAAKPSLGVCNDRSTLGRLVLAHGATRAWLLLLLLLRR